MEQHTFWINEPANWSRSLLKHWPYTYVNLISKSYKKILCTTGEHIRAFDFELDVPTYFSGYEFPLN